ncbi:MAG: peptidase U32 family protein [Bacteroidales bacterium]
MTRKDIEIMAPVGSYESLMAAIKGGADSVYFGVEQLNMRAASSNNFTVDDLRNIVTICRDNGLRSYLTLNVVVYDNEIAQMKEIVDAAASSGVTAVIASDLSVIDYAFSKGMEIHLSTQLNISNVEAIRFYSRWADVVVLARELNLDQVSAISEEIRKRDIRGPGGSLVRIEMFAHGALCMAISGKCYLSLHEYNKSANRGECNQICRRSYVVTDKETGSELEVDNQYIMSPRDLCTIGFLDRIIAAGVTVLKIEGRARPPEYVKIVSECYSQAVEAIASGNFGEERVNGWIEQLSKVFNRGFWDGYYLGRRLGEWTNRYGSSATKTKVYLGKITNYFTKIGVAEIKLENGDLETGETLLITGPSTGIVELEVDEVRVDLKSVEKALKGEFCSVRVNEYLRRSDKVYKWVDTETLRLKKSLQD